MVPFLRTRWFQFPLWALLASFVPVGCGSLWLRDYFDRRPIVWESYSDAALQRHLDQGRTVLLKVHSFT